MSEPAPSPANLPDLPSDDERTLAMFCHLSVLFGSVVVPLVIYLLWRERSEFVAFHAMQATMFQVGFALLGAAILCASFGAAGFVLIIPLIMGVVWAMRAKEGRWAGYPLIGRVGRPPADEEAS